MSVRAVIVEDEEVRSEIVALVIVVVARVTVDVAVSVPATKLEVVALVAVRLVKNPVTAVRRLAKKVDDVAFVVLLFVAKKLVVDAFTVKRLVEEALDEVIDVNVGVVLTLIVEVPVSVILFPAVR